MSTSKVILVTGGNRGIGYAIVQRLLETDPKLTVIIGTRSRANGEEAIAALKKENFTAAASVELDITSDESIAGAVSFVENTYGRLDVLINNAAIAYAQGTPREAFTSILVANVVSTSATMDAFLPLLKASSDARIINVSSSLGSLALHKSGVFPHLYTSYSASKSAVNLIGIDFQLTHPEILVQAVNPGYCKTALNNYQGDRDPKEGANVVVVLALGERGKHAGMGFWETKGDSLEATSLPW